MSSAGWPVQVKLPELDLAEYEELVEHILLCDLSWRMPVKVQMAPQDGARLLNHLKGLTLLEAEKI